jgi:excisionase family DNA binding protein
MTEKLLSTGEAAQYFSVTRDTVLKWIKSGKLKTETTIGGHHRIRLDVDQLRKKHNVDPKGSTQEYCWSYHAKKGKIPSYCLSCIAYLAKAKNCYNLSHLKDDGEYSGIHCKKTCDTCKYFHIVNKAN